jgi:hypothetical protein
MLHEKSGAADWPLIYAYIIPYMSCDMSNTPQPTDITGSPKGSPPSMAIRSQSLHTKM